jgi:hypothetical protein
MPPATGSHTGGRWSKLTKGVRCRWCVEREKANAEQLQREAQSMGARNGANNPPATE